MPGTTAPPGWACVVASTRTQGPRWTPGVSLQLQSILMPSWDTWLSHRQDHGLRKGRLWSLGTNLPHLTRCLP